MRDGAPSQQSTHEVAILGLGVAGLAAAAMLGRCGRRVILIGQLDRENRTASEVHNLPYAEGIPPADLYATIQREVARHGVAQIVDLVTTAHVDEAQHRVALSTATRTISAERLLIANGIRHEIPTWVPDGAWGRTVFACPFCHAYEHAGEDFLVVGPSMPDTLEFALLLPPHARSLTVLMPQLPALAEPLIGRVRAMNGQIIADTVATASVSRPNELIVITEGGERIVVGATVLFATTRMRTDVAKSLGLRTDRFGIPELDEDGRSSHPLVWVAGNAAKPQYVLVEAMGSGLRAGMSIHRDLALDSKLWR